MVACAGQTWSDPVFEASGFGFCLWVTAVLDHPGARILSFLSLPSTLDKKIQNLLLVSSEEKAQS